MNKIKLLAQVKCFDSNVIHEVEVWVSKHERDPKQFVMDAIVNDGCIDSVYGKQLIHRKFRDVETVIVSIKEEEK